METHQWCWLSKLTTMIWQLIWKVCVSLTLSPYPSLCVVHKNTRKLIQLWKFAFISRPRENVAYRIHRRYITGMILNSTRIYKNTFTTMKPMNLMNDAVWREFEYLSRLHRGNEMKFWKYQFNAYNTYILYLHKIIYWIYYTTHNHHIKNNTKRSYSNFELKTKMMIHIWWNDIWMGKKPKVIYIHISHSTLVRWLSGTKGLRGLIK